MDFCHINTTTTAMGDKDISTPIEIYLNQTESEVTIECKGSNGQQVSDAVIMTLTKLPNSKKDRGITEFITAIAAIAILFWLALFAIFPKQPEPTKQLPVNTIH